MKTFVEEIHMRESVIAFANARTKKEKNSAHKKIFNARRELAVMTGMFYAATRLNELVNEIL